MWRLPSPTLLASLRFVVPPSSSATNGGATRYLLSIPPVARGSSLRFASRLHSSPDAVACPPLLIPREIKPFARLKVLFLSTSQADCSSANFSLRSGGQASFASPPACAFCFLFFHSVKAK